ncbi:uncharacterized protein BP5553_03666 [Venustampulla echinocandica]|uniref:Uncharacterized protein n=1 Tax=Venustampulla echinocandica TaxID=2656787 RepID=A0A370TUX6_9HELO|nr:uncharacterized protein BP5553_03666 [Venustampulla echinocandica]RDL39326.1 hypothetical protein BP5553_03666 [Venustampulla echinocandica]
MKQLSAAAVVNSACASSRCWRGQSPRVCFADGEGRGRSRGPWGGRRSVRRSQTNEKGALWALCNGGGIVVIALLFLALLQASHHVWIGVGMRLGGVLGPRGISVEGKTSDWSWGKLGVAVGGEQCELEEARIVGSAAAIGPTHQPAAQYPRLQGLAGRAEGRSRGKMGQIGLRGLRSPHRPPLLNSARPAQKRTTQETQPIGLRILPPYSWREVLFIPKAVLTTASLTTAKRGKKKGSWLKPEARSLKPGGRTCAHHWSR